MRGMERCAARGEGRQVGGREEAYTNAANALSVEDGPEAKVAARPVPGAGERSRGT